MIESLIDFSAVLGPARDQDMRGMCLAFASSDLNQRINGLSDYLSVEYLAHHAAKAMPGWTPVHGLNFEVVVKALATPGQPLESGYPYVPSKDDQPLAAPPSNVGKLYMCTANQNGKVESTVLAALQAKKPVCLGMAINDEWFTPQHGVIKYLTTYTNDRHAVLAVGLGIDHSAGERFILVRNSWGPNWGNRGHAWLPERYLKTHLLQSLIG
ncbi:C1 family peptidase [Undibacterium curvum]|uniref:C1 family peptidase n=1 Tax=Undibacterium curvum TaxID=2762294 RepID=A0ABR7A6V8_9BURK|nr:C1 family peptidase [Undibacterium curvum]MBC3932625.1 C1 family peptidase [Undibacterium curvum]